LLKNRNHREQQNLFEIQAKNALHVFSMCMLMSKSCMGWGQLEFCFDLNKIIVIFQLRFKNKEVIREKQIYFVKLRVIF